MHGVKRLFAWMIPRFDPARFEVSLVSLRKKDLSEETLDALGIDITYLHKSKFDPSTLPALLKIIDRKKIDVLHLHGYGATTFGRMAAAMRGIPAILHEHANLTDTPWFQKIADRLLERYTDIAIAVSKSTADFVIKARLVQPEKVKVVYLGAPHEEFSRPRIGRRNRGRAARARHRAGRFRDRHRDAAARVEGQLVSRRCRAARARSQAAREVFSGGRGAAARVARGAGPSARPRRSIRVRRIRARRRRCAERVRPQRLSVAVGRHAADGVRSAGVRQADRGHRRRRAARRPDRRTRRAHRAEARCCGARRCDCRSDRSPRRARAACRGRARHGTALRHHRLRQEDGAAVRAALRQLARDDGRGVSRARSRSRAADLSFLA